MLNRPQVRGFFWGVGATLAAAALWPVLKPALRPLGVRAAASLVQLAEQTMAAVARAREDIADVLAEAREAAHSAPAAGGAATPTGGDADLRSTVSSLQSEVREMRELLSKLVEQRGG